MVASAWPPPAQPRAPGFLFLLGRPPSSAASGWASAKEMPSAGGAPEEQGPEGWPRGEGIERLGWPLRIGCMSGCSPHAFLTRPGSWRKGAPSLGQNSWLRTTHRREAGRHPLSVGQGLLPGMKAGNCEGKSDSLSLAAHSGGSFASRGGRRAGGLQMAAEAAGAGQGGCSCPLYRGR